MKITFVLGLLGMICFGQIASANCLGEAQIIAKIVRVDEVGTHCEVYTEASEVRFYSESGVCPLYLDEVLSRGVYSGFKTAHECAFEPGDELNGILVKNESGFIVLE